MSARSIQARIPAGVKDGQKIRLRGKGGEGDPGAPKGDLILTVAVDKHPVFGRDGDNLTVDLPVTFAEAALGATVSVPTLDGTPVRVKVAPGTPSGRVPSINRWAMRPSHRRHRAVHTELGAAGDHLREPELRALGRRARTRARVDRRAPGGQRVGGAGQAQRIGGQRHLRARARRRHRGDRPGARSRSRPGSSAGTA